MKRIERDFIALFNVLWYRDFPLSENHKTKGGRAEWTTHIGVCIRACADLLGYFTYFERGLRTDAIIRDNKEKDIAHIEWEWKQPFNEKVNEIKKLHNERTGIIFSVFISYSNVENLEKNMNAIRKQWGQGAEPLLIFLVTYSTSRRKRYFDTLNTYVCQRGKLRKLRSQPALPWQVPGSRWEAKQNIICG
jgi:hypothetical protein